MAQTSPRKSGRSAAVAASAREDRDRLVEQSRKLEAVLSSIAEGVNIVDADGRVVLVNQGFMQLYGFPAELAVPGTPLEAFIRHRLAAGRRLQSEPDDLDIETLTARRVAELRAAGSGEFEERLSDGRIVHVRRQRLADGMLVSTYHDVTAQREREQQFAMLATAVGQSGDSVEVVDTDYRLLYVNPAFTRLTGYTREEALGRTPAELLRSDQHTPAFFQELQTTVEGGEVWKGRLISRHKNGHLIYQDATISPVHDHEGRLTHSVAIKRDVGEQVRAAEALRASEVRYRAIVEDQTELILRFAADFTITFVNRAYERHLGRPREAIIGSSVLELMDAEQQAVFLRQLEGLTPDHPTVNYEMLLRRAGDRAGWEQWTDRAIFDPEGRVLEYQSVGRDITERKGAEEALRASEARFRTIVEDQTEFISRFTPDFTITFLNRAYAHQLGRPRETILGSSVLKLMSAGQQELFQRQLADLTPDVPTVSYEMEYQKPDGRAGWEQWTDRALFDERGRVVEYQSVGRDITEQKRAAAELRESEERFRAIAEGVPIPLSISRSDISEMLYANQLALETYGVRPGPRRANILSAWVDPQDRLDLVAEVARRGRVDGGEVQLRRADGRVFWALVSARALSYAGQPAILIASTDITERRHMEEALRASEARFRAMVEDQTEFISRLTPDFTITFVNGALASHMRCRPEELIGASLLELMPDAHKSRFLARIADLSRTNPVTSYEIETVHRDGRRCWEQWTERALFDGEGQLVEYQAVGREITSQKLAEQELREAEERFRTIAEGVPLAISIARPREPEIVFANERAREAFGLRAGDAGEGVTRVWADPDHRKRLVRQLLESGRVDGFEAQLTGVDGAPVWTLISARRMTVGGRDAMLAAITDITERRQMEQAVRESEARLTAFLEHAPIAMYLKDFEGRYVLTNPEMSKLFARPAEEMIGLTAADAGVRLDLDNVVERDREILRGDRSTVYEEQVPELDAYRWSLVIRFPVRDAAGVVTHIGGFHVDISRTKEFEQLLKQSEQRFRTIAEAHPVPMVIVSVPEFDVLFANAAFQELFRLTPARVGETDTAELYADPADGDRVRGLIGERGRLDDFEAELRRADGTVFPASLSSRLIEYEGRPAIVTSVTDLTKIKHAETEIARQREALHQSEKLNALGTLLAGVAHELNNPLSVVVGQAILLEDFAGDPAAKSRAVKIRAAADRCARIVRTFLAMARKRPSERGPVDINEAIEAALELLGYGLRTADVRVARDLTADLPPVWGDSDQLHQVLTNLIINAQHALQNVDPPRELRLATRREGDLVRIEVEDSGPGIDQVLAKRIFEPFFTTKPTGTGIGLSVCHGIVGAHDGSIELVSRPGSGACFVVRLPLRLDEGRTQAGSAGEAAGAADRAHPPGRRRGRGRRPLR